MAQYSLTKTAKGSKYLYEVKDEQGNVISKRTSANDYIACSVNGKFYFGKKSLIGKGAYAEEIAYIEKNISYNKETWMAERNEWLSEMQDKIKVATIKGYSQERIQKLSDKLQNEIDEYYNLSNLEKDVKDKNEWGKKAIADMKIVYLQK